MSLLVSLEIEGLGRSVWGLRASGLGWPWV